ncbi:thrombospondin type-1 domain-containing protein 4 [Nilaparvata lugens]|uniref:thrombospondin type-1 domain-containing protein 4 n=1 Tax=Nilaparvata lugens TaxID=108931 RepID=UPI00193D8C25|nr:thrombospondin type-1 domain-containing protein 4 [Nilaparvata lugens]
MYLLLRAVIAIWFLGVATRQEVIGIGKYPLQVHRMYRERVAEGLLGIWSQWSSWSECSRSCGGGISTQTRECRPRVEGRHKRKVSGGHCIGMYKRMHICNTQDCPPGSVDFRRVQCEAYNGKLFMGRAYTWEPFTDAGNECALNCRALGYRFYATLNNSVADGTSCRPSSKDRATRAICVGGMCKSVGCDGVIGSERRLDSCGVCGGNNSTCRVVSGLFTRPQLPLGYNLITQIPRAACNISISHLKPTRNYLALRRVDGTYVLNGNWAINWSGDYEAVGTKFVYRRDAGESIAAPGPLDQPIDLMLIYQQPNSGIKYQYQLPMSQADSMLFPPQEAPIAPPLINQPPDGLNIPSDGVPSGNNVDSYRWVGGEWSACSVTCGEGVQTRELVCRQEITADLIMTVAEGACLRPPAPHLQRTRACFLTPCSPNDANLGAPAWFYTEWSQQCSEGCGTGVQTRKVHCSGGQCDPSTRPEDSRACSSDKQCGPKWFSGAWTQCSAVCGWGRQSRAVVCVETIGGKQHIVPADSCQLNQRPDIEQDCQVQPCGSQWYTGEWATCSKPCGLGVQKRDLRCLDEHELFSTTCSEQKKPAVRRSCNAHPCTGEKEVIKTDASPVNDSNNPGEQAPADNTDNPDCTDVFPNCQLVVQARLCKYKYYRSSCCQACKNKA